MGYRRHDPFIGEHPVPTTYYGVPRGCRQSCVQPLSKSWSSSYTHGWCCRRRRGLFARFISKISKWILKAQQEPARHEVDHNKLKNSHEDELKNVPDVPTRLQPYCGPDPVPLLKRPPKNLSTKPICNADCICCYKTKNKLPRDNGSPTSRPPTASSPAIKREDSPVCKAIRRGIPFEKKCLRKTP